MGRFESYPSGRIIRTQCYIRYSDERKVKSRIFLKSRKNCFTVP